MQDSRIIVALDFPEAKAALALAERLREQPCRVKVGKELFTRAGPQLVEQLQQDGFEVFLDLKYHDIPNTVAGACRAAADLGVWMVNVHAQGGRAMLEAAREAVANSGHRPKLIAVTLLTSLGAADIAATGLHGEPQENVLRLARLAADSGLDGVVCSPLEIHPLRAALPREFCLVTPGIRPQGSQVGDQKRIMTPPNAIKAGADYLVIGRPITAAPDPLAALQAIQDSLAS